MQGKGEINIMGQFLGMFLNVTLKVNSEAMELPFSIPFTELGDNPGKLPGKKGNVSYLIRTFANKNAFFLSSERIQD